MAPLTYIGNIPIEHPTLGLTWTPGQTQEVPDDLAADWDADPTIPFAGPRKKAAREARAAAQAAAEAQDQTQPQAQADEQQPAESAVQEGESA